jgi:GNAT superfamily N-acetyltransferase
VDVDLTPTLELDEAALAEVQDLRRYTLGPDSRLDTSLRFSWSGIDDTVCVVRVREQGRLASVLFVSQRTIQVDSRATRAGGIRGVMTHPQYRRRGLARAALERAHTFMWQDLKVELAILFSSRMAVPLYASLGWQVLTGPVWCEQPGGTINYTQLSPNDPPMVLPPPPTGGQAWSIQEIDLCGLPW